MLDLGLVAQIVRERITANMTDITIPKISVVEGDSWKNVTDFLVIPKLTVMKDNGLFVVPFFSSYILLLVGPLFHSQCIRASLTTHSVIYYSVYFQIRPFIYLLI